MVPHGACFRIFVWQPQGMLTGSMFERAFQVRKPWTKKCRCFKVKIFARMGNPGCICRCKAFNILCSQLLNWLLHQGQVFQVAVNTSTFSWLLKNLTLRQPYPTQSFEHCLPFKLFLVLFRKKSPLFLSVTARRVTIIKLYSQGSLIT